MEALAAQGVQVRGWLAGPRSRLTLGAPATMTDDKVAQLVEVFDRLAKKLPFPEAALQHRGVPTLARPESYAMGTPAPLHWSTVDLPERRRDEHVEPLAAPQSTNEGLSLKARVLDAVETATWRATSVGSAQLRRSADALRTLIDRRRR